MRTVLLMLLAAAPVAAQSDPTLGQRLDSIAGRWVERKYAVGVVAAVIQDHDTLLMRSYGKADVEWDVPMPLVAPRGKTWWSR